MNLVCQLRVSPDGTVLMRVWEAPAAFEVVPDEGWEEKPAPPPGLAAFMGAAPPLAAGR